MFSGEGDLQCSDGVEKCHVQVENTQRGEERREERKEERRERTRKRGQHTMALCTRSSKSGQDRVAMWLNDLHVDSRQVSARYLR